MENTVRALLCCSLLALVAREALLRGNKREGLELRLGSGGSVGRGGPLNSLAVDLLELLESCRDCESVMTRGVEMVQGIEIVSQGLTLTLTLIGWSKA